MKLWPSPKSCRIPVSNIFICYTRDTDYSLPLLDSGLRDASNNNLTNGSAKVQESGVKIEAEPSVRDEIVAEKAWSAEEQKMLEQALVTYPKDTVKRWDRIGESIPGRTKEECIKRFKELAAMVQAKREAQKAAAARKS